MPEPSYFKSKMTIEELKRCKPPDIDLIPAELIKAGGRKICSELLKLINSVWNKEELPEQWKESVTVPISKKGDKTDCSNHRAISLLSTAYKILSNILLSRLTTFAEGITGKHQCAFRHNRSSTDQIFCMCQVLEKRLE